MKQLRLIVIDDSVVYRKIMLDVLDKIPDVEVVGTAPDGKIGFEKIVRFEADVVTLDVEMPKMDGIATLKHLKKENRDCDVIMVSSYTTDGAQATIEALELGAFDFITKPSGKDTKENARIIERQIKPILNAISTRKMLRVAKVSKNLPQVHKPQSAKKEVQLISQHKSYSRPEIAAIGISTGGPNALIKVIPKLPKNLALPVVIVQHMPVNFTASLAESLNRKSKVSVVEAKNEQRLEPGTVYFAPGGKQMKVVSASSGNILTITDDAPENNCKPSVNYLFRSIAKVYRDRALGIIMTGMGADGVLGLRLMKRHGVRVIAQTEETCVIFGMPGEAMKAGVVDELVPLNQIAAEITNISTPP